MLTIEGMNILRKLFVILTTLLAVSDICIAGANDLIYQAKANHPPAAGGKLGIIWIDDTNPPMYSAKNAVYAVSFIQSKCYYTWQVMDAQSDFRRFIQSYYQGSGNAKHKAEQFAKYSGYTYVLALMPYEVNVENVTFNGTHAGYGTIGLKDVSTTLFSFLYDANGYVFFGNVGGYASNQKGAVTDIMEKIWPEVIDRTFYKYQGFFTVSGESRRFGERTGKIP